jgi:transketolase
MMMSGRDAYRDELTRLAGNDSSILCIEVDLGGGKHPFQAAYPERFFNVGVAEGAAIDLGAGLAKAGFRPFVSTFASFAALRAAESIKLSMGYMGAPIVIVAPYAGVSGAWFGTTHHCLEDLAVLQAIPGIRIAAPYGEEQTRRVIRAAAVNRVPFYIRLGRNAAYKSFPHESGSGMDEVVWREADGESGMCLVSIGETGAELCIAARERRPDLSHVHLCYLDRPSLSPVIDFLSFRYRTLLVVEEHRPGGSVASTLALLLPQCCVYAHNCGNQWPTEGGRHEEVLATLGYGLEQLLGQIQVVERGSAWPTIRARTQGGAKTEVR